MTIKRVTMCIVVLFAFAASVIHAEDAPKTLKVFPPEHKKVTDPKTGAELLFLTTAPSKDTNLYFHERSWLADESVILFNSDRKDGGLMGYICATGELAQLAGLGSATAAALDNHIYGIRKDQVIELALDIKKAESPAARSTVTASERVVCVLPKGLHTTALNASCDGKRLACGFGGTDTAKPGILVVDLAEGASRTLCEIPKEIGYAGHIQWSRTNPNLLSFAGLVQRLWVVDARDGIPKNPYTHRKDELVTHESWWVEDQLLFCGGTHPKPQEDAHVKVLNISTGQVRIIGEGSWWPEATAPELAKRNWWHASGSADGKCVAADNWHGDIMLFEGKTTRPHLLTSGHRTYGKGEHPHVGWDRTGKKVIFASHMLGDANVCVAAIPDSLQEQNK